MPRFFFNHSSHGDVCVDDIGTEFPSLEAAYLDTCEAALLIAFEKLRARQDPAEDAFEIIDRHGHALMRVPFSEVLRPVPPRRTPIVRPRSHIMAACQEQLARSRILKAELRAELNKTQLAFEAIRETIARLRVAD